MKEIREALSTPKTRQELVKITGISDRTLRYNLSILKKKRMIIEYRILKDMRKKVYLWISS